MTVKDTQDGPLARLTCTLQVVKTISFNFHYFVTIKKKQTKRRKKRRRKKEEKRQTDRNPKQAGISLSPRCHASDGHPGKAVKVRAQRHCFLDMTTLAISWSSPSL